MLLPGFGATFGRLYREYLDKTADALTVPCMHLLLAHVKYYAD